MTLKPAAFQAAMAERPTKIESQGYLMSVGGGVLDTRTGNESMGFEESQMEREDNEENLSTNVYLRKRIESGFKRVVNKQQINEHSLSV
jgi:hypothetical protein